MGFQIKLQFYRKGVRTVGAFCISFFYLLTLCQCKSPDQKGSGSDAATETISGITTVKAPLPTAKTQDSISINESQATQVLE